MPKRQAALFIALLLAGASAFASPLERQMRDLERIRGLSFLHDVRVVNLGRSELPRAMQEQITRSLPYSFDDYMLALEALRLIERNPGDLQGRFIRLLEQQVLAFYDPLTHVYYALDAPPSGVPAMAGVALNDAVAVHELMHAMQDQRFGLGGKDHATRNDWDESLAVHAVAEGEASLVMMAELVAPLGRSLDDIASNDALLDGLASASAMMRSADPDSPRYFLDSLAFPYVAGMRFIVAAYRRGGWAAVNRMYDDPPRSTREVLHPEEYFAGKRTANALAGAGTERTPGLLSVEHLGEWHWGFLVGEANARGWTGDRVQIVQDRFCRPTVLVETQWESPERARAFRDAYDSFLRMQKIDAEMLLKGTAVIAAYGADDRLALRFVNDRR